MKSTMNMVWHIFKKDVKLLWPFAVGVAGIQFAWAAVLFMLDHHNENSLLASLAVLLEPVTLVAAVFLIVVAVQQDPIPGVRQDWLIRPIRRRDLLLAKLLLVLVMVHGPILLADTLPGLVNGFPIGQILAAAVSRSLYLLIGFSIPVLGFASLTRNMTEALIGGVAIFLGFAVITTMLSRNGYHDGPTRATGEWWITEVAMFTAVCLGAGVVLAMQYFYRKTKAARGVIAGAALLCIPGYFIPWHLAFGIEQRFSPAPGAGSSIRASFEPSLGRFRLPEGMTRNMATDFNGARRDEASTVYVPLRISGLPDRWVLNGDRAEVRVMAMTGELLYSGLADDFRVRQESPEEPVRFIIGARRFSFWRDIGPQELPALKASVPGTSEALVYQGLPLPRNLYTRIKGEPVRIEFDYSLTLMRGTQYTLPALGADEYMPVLGHCTTQMDADGDDVQLHCMRAGAGPSCGSAFLEHPPSGQRNPVRFVCWPNYSPYFGQFTPDAMSRFAVGLQFRDLSGLTKYPVDAAKLPEAHIVMRVYRAQDHFARKLIIPEIRLSDWESVERNQVAEKH
jgi:hypothetical protein